MIEFFDKCFDFHWVDNPTNLKDPISLCSSGDSIPNRRFNFKGYYWLDGRLTDEVRQSYGAFSYSHTHLSNVISYIIKQKEHHSRRPFKEEAIRLLKNFK